MSGFLADLGLFTGVPPGWGSAIGLYLLGGRPFLRIATDKH